MTMLHAGEALKCVHTESILTIDKLLTESQYIAFPTRKQTISGGTFQSL